MLIKKIKISGEHLRLIKRDREKCNPFEACGVLVGGVKYGIAQIDYVIPTKNVMRSRVRFEIDPEELYSIWDKAEKNGKEIVGIYHSHLGKKEPSHWDITCMKEFALVWIIAGSDAICAYVWEDGDVKEIAMVRENTNSNHKK